MIALELHGSVLAATIAVQMRLLPSLARTRPLSGRAEQAGIAALALATCVRLAALFLPAPGLSPLADGVLALALLALFATTGLWRPGIAPTVLAPATLLPGRTRWVLRAAWGGLLIGAVGQATGALPNDTVTHALTTVYLVPLILVVGFRMLPRVSAYPIRFPMACGFLVWCGLIGGLLRAFGPLNAGKGGWMLAWAGGSLLTLAVLSFAAMAWSPWGVPTGAPRRSEGCGSAAGVSSNR